MATFKLNLKGLESIDGNSVNKTGNNVAVAHRNGQVDMQAGPEAATPEATAEATPVLDPGTTPGLIS